MSDYERRLIILTALVAVVTAVYALVSIGQWLAIREEAEATMETAIAAKQSADAAIAETKAFLTVAVPFKVIPELGYLEFAVNNYGKIPTKRLDITDYIVKAGLTSIPAIECQTAKLTAYDIPPGMDAAVFQQSIAGLIDPDERTKLTTLDSHGLVKENLVFAVIGEYDNGFNSKLDTLTYCGRSWYDDAKHVLLWPACEPELLASIKQAPCKQIKSPY
jgi:hypothetical protein